MEVAQVLRSARDFNEELDAKNDSVIILKYDGGITRIDDLELISGNLTSVEHNFAFRPTRGKITIYESTRLGQPPVSKENLHIVAHEPEHPEEAPYFINRDLHEIRDRSRIGTKRSGLFKRKRSKLNILFGVTAIFLLIFALVGVPVFEIGIDDGSDPSPAFQKVEEVEQS